MATRQENKQSTPKIAKTSKEQDEIRRAAKSKRRRKGGRAVQPGETFSAGLFQDRLNKRGTTMLDLLEPHMVSGNTGVDLLLKQVVIVYVSEFTMNMRRVGWPVRHTTALKKAMAVLNGVEPRLRNYAKQHLNTAYYATCPEKH